MNGWILLSAWALAAPTEAPSVQDAWHHHHRQRFAEAAKLSAQIIRDDPSNLEAHRAYLDALFARDTGISRIITTQYHDWQTQDPDDTVARFAYAHTLHIASEGEACDEALSLLEPLPDRAEDRYAALRISHEWLTSCEDARAADVAAQFRLDDEGSPVERAYGLVLRARAGDWTTVSAAPPDIWQSDAASTVEIVRAARASKDRRARRVLKKIAAWSSGWQDTQDPVALHAMVEAMAAMGKDAQEAHERLNQHDSPTQAQRPSSLWGESDGSLTRSKLWLDIQEAAGLEPLEDALAALDELASRVPESGRARAYWSFRRGLVLRRLDRLDEAYEAARDHARHRPDGLLPVLAWAQHAAERGEDIDEALVAMERVMPNIHGYTIDEGSDLAWWLDDTRYLRMNIGSTYGWLLYRAERYEEAADVLVQTTQFEMDVEAAARTGLALIKTGHDEKAWPYLVRASTREPTDGALALAAGTELGDEVRRELERLWPTRATWHPEGLDGWLKTGRRAVLSSKE